MESWLEFLEQALAELLLQPPRIESYSMAAGINLAINLT